MSQPLDRNAKLPALGAVDTEGGEFWVENAFQMPTGGHNLSAYEPNRLFLNVAGEPFFDASFASAADIDSDSRSVVAADFDGDGAQDLLVASVGGGPLRLFLNRVPDSGHRVRLELTGAGSNRAAIGTRVIAEAGGRRIVRDLFPANGGTGLGPVEMILGVGSAARIDRLTVRWPGGSVETFEGLPVDCGLAIVEGQGEFRHLPLARGDDS